MHFALMLSYEVLTNFSGTSRYSTAEAGIHLRRVQGDSRPSMWRRAQPNGGCAGRRPQLQYVHYRATRPRAREFVGWKLTGIIGLTLLLRHRFRLFMHFFHSIPLLDTTLYSQRTFFFCLLSNAPARASHAISTSSTTDWMGPWRVPAYGESVTQ